MATCQICLENVTEAEALQHEECVKLLFGTNCLPHIPFTADSVTALAADMVGKMSISGVQEKVSLILSADQTSLVPVAVGGRFILKPPSIHFRAMPENEHLSMRLAAHCGIEVPPVGLVRLNEGVLAFVIQRFDHLSNGSKLFLEDFCQLAELSSRQKYEGSAELCAKLVRKHATDPEAELAKLFRQFLFSWWVGNGDLHLKNLSLLTRADGSRVLSPAYDLLCTKLIIPDDNFALQMQGKRKEFRRKNWIVFGEYCKLPVNTVKSLLKAQAKGLNQALDLVQTSFLPENQKSEYAKILKSNTALLSKK